MTDLNEGSHSRVTKSLHMIRDLEALKTIADPLRLRIFEALTTEPQSVKMIAAKLGLAPARLYYHVSLLEENGLVQVVGERLVGNLVEKLYQAVARQLDIAPDLLSFRERTGQENIGSLAVSTLDATREDLVRSLDARRDALSRGAPECPRSIVVTRRTALVPQTRVEAFRARLVELLEDFDAADLDDALDEQDVHAYALAVALYPQFDYEEDIDVGK